MKSYYLSEKQSHNKTPTGMDKIKGLMVTSFGQHIQLLKLIYWKSKLTPTSKNNLVLTSQLENPYALSFGKSTSKYVQQQYVDIFTRRQSHKFHYCNFHSDLKLEITRCSLIVI